MHSYCRKINYFLSNQSYMGQVAKAVNHATDDNWINE